MYYHPSFFLKYYVLLNKCRDVLLLEGSEPSSHLYNEILLKKKFIVVPLKLFVIVLGAKMWLSFRVIQNYYILGSVYMDTK